MHKKICAAALAVIMSVGIMCRGVVSAADSESGSAGVSQEYVLNTDAGEEFVQSVLDKKDVWKNKLQNIANQNDDDFMFQYMAWFQDLDLDGVPEFLAGGRASDGTKYFYIFDKNGHEYFINQNVGIKYNDWGYISFGYNLYKDNKTGQLVYLAKEDTVKKLNYSSESGFSEEVLCCEEKNESTGNTVYKIGSETVDKSQYDKYCRSLSRYTPVTINYNEIDLKSSDKDLYMNSYNAFGYKIPTAENSADDMVYMVRGAYDILSEEMEDNPFECYVVSDWSYNCWFEDLNLDGVPEFIVGGIVDTKDNEHIRLYEVLDLFHESWIDESQVNENHGAGHDGFGYKLYKDSQTGNYSYMTVDTYKKGNKQTKTVRQLNFMFNEYKEYDICSEQTDTSTNKTTYTVDGKNVSSSEYKQFTDDLNSRYTEVKVNVKVINLGDIFEESALEEAYNAYSIDESFEGNHFNYAGNNFDNTKGSSAPMSSQNQNKGSAQNSTSSQNAVNSNSSANPSTGIDSISIAALTAAVSALVLSRKKKK